MAVSTTIIDDMIIMVSRPTTPNDDANGTVNDRPIYLRMR